MRNLNKLSVLSLITLLAPSLTFASSNIEGSGKADLDYGELYVVQKTETAKKRWETSFGYSYGFSNPFLGIHQFSLGFHRLLGDFFFAGIQGSLFVSTTKSLAEDLRNNLQVQNVATHIYDPTASVYAQFGVIPFQGIVNIFSVKSVVFDISTGMGVGIAQYRFESSVNPTLRFFLAPKMMFTPTLGFTASLATNVDRFSAGDWQNRVDAGLGILVRF